MSTAKTKSLDTETVVDKVGLVFGIVLAFIGLVDMFPLYIYVLAYSVSFLLIMRLVWKWESAKRWTRRKKLILTVPVAVFIFGLFTFHYSNSITGYTAWS